MQQERTRTICDLGRELERLRARRDADLQQLRWRVMAAEAEPATKTRATLLWLGLAALVTALLVGAVIIVTVRGHELDVAEAERAPASPAPVSIRATGGA